MLLDNVNALRLVAPIVPVRFSVPNPAFKLRLFVPAELLLTAPIVRLPLEEFKLILLVTVVVPPYVCDPVDVMLLPSDALPEIEMLPRSALIGAAELKVKVPLFVTLMLPLSAFMPFCTLNDVPRSVAEPKLTLPAKVVAPVAALVCVSAPEILT